MQAQEILRSNSESQWTLAAGPTMIPAPKVNADGRAVSQTGYNARDWMSATVPGTVLKTMVDRGVYHDPDYGLNNLAVPESLNKQDYWYRVKRSCRGMPYDPGEPALISAALPSR